MSSTSDLTSTNTTKNKSSVSETGHAKNVANFFTLKAFVGGYGTKYNPSKKVLELPQLEIIHTAGKQAVKNVVDAVAPYETVVNTRADEFEDVPEYATQLINALQSSDASERTIEDGKEFLRKIRGQRAEKKIEPKPGEPTPVTHSASQTSFDQTIQHMEGIAALLKNEPSYAPNEPELRVDAVEEKIARLISTNDAVATPEETISNARLQRDNILYNNPDALVTVAKGVKTYVKSVFKAHSPEYRQISGIPFKVITKD